MALVIKWGQLNEAAAEALPREIIPEGMLLQKSALVQSVMCGSLCILFLFFLLLPLLAGEGVGGEQPCLPGNGLVPMGMQILMEGASPASNHGGILGSEAQGEQEQTPALSHVHLWFHLHPFPPVTRNSMRMEGPATPGSPYGQPCPYL